MISGAANDSPHGMDGDQHLFRAAHLGWPMIVQELTHFLSLGSLQAAVARIAAHLRALATKRSVAHSGQNRTLRDKGTPAPMPIQRRTLPVVKTRNAQSPAGKGRAKRKPAAAQAKARLRRDALRAGCDLEPGFLSRLRG